MRVAVDYPGHIPVDCVIGAYEQMTNDPKDGRFPYIETAEFNAMPLIERTHVMQGRKPGTYFDAKPYNGFFGYINGKYKGHRNISSNIKMQKAFLITTKPLYPGDELILNYGKSFAVGKAITK